MALTDDPTDPRLKRGIDREGGKKQGEVYLVLPDEERKKGFIRPLRIKYLHLVCGKWTTMADKIAETYARNPEFYGATFCVECGGHFKIGVDGEFAWEDGSMVGT